jgi:FkbM family methyltransferase
MDYEARLQAFYGKLDLTGDVVFDIGANIGRHAIPLAQQVGLEGTIHAFEPIPKIRGQLVANAELAGVNNIIVYPFALANVPARVQFHYIPNLPEESGIKARREYNAPPDTAQLIDLYTHRLDDLCPASEMAFMKIDIEGGELDMLKGATKVLRSARPIVAFECGAASFLGYHDTPEEIFSLFKNIGFSVYSILGHHMPDERTFREASYAQAFWDYIAIPAEKIDLARLLA